MRRDHTILLPYAPWLLLLLGTDAAAALLLWLADAQAFRAMSVLLVLGSLFSFSAVCLVLVRAQQKRKEAFSAFLASPDEYHEELLLKTVPSAARPSLLLLGSLLRENKAACGRLAGELNDYEEYVEAWAHEVKTPLSLLTLLLDNRGDTLPAAIRFKLDYIRSRMQESVDQMLFFARLKSPRKDHRFEPVCLRTCLEELLEDYRPLLDEKQFEIQCSLSDETVYSDKRSLTFLLGQILSNSIKYCRENPVLTFDFREQDGFHILRIHDNGIGVRRCDLPYLFEKGFTGDSGDGRKKATGMGLYLAREIAAELNLTLSAQSEWGKEFEIRISFPIVRSGR